MNDQPLNDSNLPANGLHPSVATGPRRWTAWRVLRWVLLIYSAAQVLWLIGLYVDRRLTIARNEKILAETIAETDRLEPGWRWEAMQAARPVIPPEQDSAIVLANIREVLPDHEHSRKALQRPDGTDLLQDIPPNRMLADEDGRLLARILMEHEKAVRLTRQLAELPCGWHELRLEANPFRTNISHIQAIRYVFLLLSLDAESHARNGDSRAALRSVQGILFAARSLRDQPSMIAQTDSDRRPIQGH